MKRIVLIAALVVSACTPAVETAEAPQASKEIGQGQLSALFDFGRPYLSGALPGGYEMIGALPEAGSLRMAEDEEAAARALGMRGGVRWQLAASDADLGKDWFDHAFACTAGHHVSEEAAPAIANLLRRAATDFASSTSEAKEKFMRQRPFMVNGEGSCTPDSEEYLRTNGSYPSGHSAIGYGTGLVLASLFPDKGAMLVARGRAYGDSRWICNVHWLSDVEEGQTFAAATYARLQSSPDYQADYAAAKAEVATLTAQPDAASCSAEAAALGKR